jgi:hypothetical protein
MLCFSSGHIIFYTCYTFTGCVNFSHFFLSLSLEIDCVLVL